MANTKITNPELFNLGDSTSATQLPVMTTTQRIAMNAAPTLNVDYLVVAGGGGGGGSNYGYTAGGGGGAGGLLTNVGGTSLSLATGGSGYTITVGDSGIIGTPTSNGGNGYNSLFYNVTSIGGSGGGSAYPSPTSPSTGGSGGGSNAYANTPGSGTPNQGFAGGTAYGTNAGNGSGGGGGSSAVGANGLVGAGGNGGNGTTNAITVSSGTGPYYAGGGGGGQWLWQYSGTPTPGTGGTGGGGAGGTSVGSAYDGSAGSTNTGGGGGGGSAKYTDGPVAGVNGGLGGSGIVILRYPTADIASYTATGLTPTETTVGTDTVLSFTTVGTGTIIFTSSTPTGTISDGEMIFNSDTDKVEYWDGTKWYGITYEAQNPCYNYNDPVTPYINFNLTDPLGTNASNNVLNISPATYTGQITQTVAPTTDATLGYKYFDEPTWDNGLQLSATPSLGYYGTIIAWVKFDSTTSGTQRHTIFGEGDSSNTSRWMILRYRNASSEIQWSCNGSTANRTCQVTQSLNNNVWYQIAFVKNSNSTAQFYLNGVSAGTTSYSNGSTTEWFNDISGNKWNWGSFQRGGFGAGYDPMYAKSGSLKVFVDAALSASQILADYNYTKTCYGIS